MVDLLLQLPIAILLTLAVTCKVVLIFTLIASIAILIEVAKILAVIAVACLIFKALQIHHARKLAKRNRERKCEVCDKISETPIKIVATEGGYETVHQFCSNAHFLDWLGNHVPLDNWREEEGTKVIETSTN